MRILVTHQVQYTKKADEIIVLEKVSSVFMVKAVKSKQKMKHNLNFVFRVK